MAQWRNAKLSNTKFGILCLTSEALSSSWLNFEAGALAKTVDSATFVCPYLIGLEPSQLPMPLAQFHVVKADKDGTFNLAKTINDALGDVALPKDQLKDAFDLYWPRLEKVLQELPAVEKKPAKRGAEDMLGKSLRSCERWPPLKRKGKKVCFSGPACLRCRTCLWVSWAVRG